MDMNTLRLMLMYMYTNTLKDHDGTNVRSLYIAANKYELPSLKERCASYMLKRRTKKRNPDLSSIRTARS
ncbi:hypothetical protein CEXT_344331 [Caerostris extrusa]|uniref:BTB domain-containing protein n=1 Tax=Caerostris extrusa TaxID=172846 RepID=A0AAV4TZL8_CAEEX|nr:hypothetical protein CEXT_344331 [Caerostris extrusa]